MESQPRRAERRTVLRLALLVGAALFFMACSTGGLTQDQANLEQTAAALSRQATEITYKGTEMALGQTQTALEAAVAQAQAAPTQAPPTQPPPPTEAPPPTVAPLPTEAPLPTAAPVDPPTEAPPPPPTEAPTAEPAKEMTVEEVLAKNPRILLFEDVSGTSYYRYIKAALQQAGYSFTDVGSAQGWLKDQLLGGVDWDLIIVANENRGAASGEFFSYLYDYLKKGTAVILEAWFLDNVSSGKIKPILDDCGVEVERDWYDPPTRSLWFLKPEHPLLHYPNITAPSLRNFDRFWFGDLGDLMRTKRNISPDDVHAELIAGTLAEEKDRHATLMICYDGRFILQTFSTHEYGDNMTQMWQNYVYYTLKNHYLQEP